MRAIRMLTSAATLTLLSHGALPLEVDYPNKGSDGPLVWSTVAEIELAHSLPGSWDEDPAALAAAQGEDAGTAAGRGVYDGQRWAVVFKYEAVRIEAGARLTLGQNHPSNPPVVWLVDGDVEIDGTLYVGPVPEALGTTVLVHPGPGGFAGGFAATTDAPGSAGFGPGGGRLGTAGSGSHATLGNAGTVAYGSPALLPLIGGSGAAAAGSPVFGAGGGAILIVARGDVRLGPEGEIVAAAMPSGGGAGGAVRVVAESLSGTGHIDARGAGGTGGDGRIRIEVKEDAGGVQRQPVSSDAQPADPVRIWPPASTPTVRIVEVDDVAVPDDPGGVFSETDVTVAGTDRATRIVVETENVGETDAVYVRVTPRSGDFVNIAAEFKGYETAGSTRATWHAVGRLPDGAMALQARAVKAPPGQ